MGEEIGKRDFLKAAVIFGAGVAGGYSAKASVQDGEQAMMAGGGGKMPVSDLDDINLVLFKADEDPDDFEPNQQETWAVHPDHGVLYWDGGTQ